MRKHVLAISQPPKDTPAAILPDGAITGNGDVTVTLGGTADRVRLHIGKADFWKADGRVYTEHRGGISPLGLVDILLPHLAYADYQVGKYHPDRTRPYLPVGVLLYLPASA